MDCNSRSSNATARRLSNLDRHVAGAAPAGGLLDGLRRLFGGGGGKDAEPEAADALPAVSGVVQHCFSPPQKEELEARQAGGWDWAGEGRFIRGQVDSIELGLAPSGEAILAIGETVILLTSPPHPCRNTC